MRDKKNQKHFLSKSIEWIENHNAPFLTLTGGSLQSLGEVFSLVNWIGVSIPVWVVGIVATAFGGLKSLESSKIIANLEREKVDLLENITFLQNSLQSIIERFLIQINDDLGLDHHCRITLYRFENNFIDGESPEFVLLAKYSRNPKYNIVELGALKFLGALAKTWEAGEYFFIIGDQRRDSQDGNKISKKQWKSNLKLLGYTQAHFNRKILKPVEEYGYALHDGDHKNVMAILLFESDELGKIQSVEIRSLLEKRSIDATQLLEDTMKYKPGIGLAGEQDL